MRDVGGAGGEQVHSRGRSGLDWRCPPESIQQQLYLPAARPYLSLMSRVDASPEHIELLFRSTEDALGPCAKRLHDQLILPFFKEHDNRRSLVGSMEFGKNFQPRLAPIFQGCVDQADINVPSRETVKNILLRHSASHNFELSAEAPQRILQQLAIHRRVEGDQHTDAGPPG